MLPALHFEPIVMSAAAARGTVADLAASPDGLVLMVFPNGDVGDDTASVMVGKASNAWPNGARRRSLPPLPALRMTGVHDRSRAELLAAAEAAFAGRPLQRRFAYDALVLRADGAISALFWTITARDPDCDAPSVRPRSSWRSLPAGRLPRRARR